jgi:cytochrome c556
MKLMKLSLVLLFAVFTAVAATPRIQDEQEYSGLMKSVQATVGSIRKNLEAKAAEDVAKDAGKLEEAFKKSEEFWTKRKTEDAIKWSQQSQAAAKEVGAAAKGGDWEKAAASMRGVMGGCAGCHGAHREKLPEGGYKIK